jgi:hypothetical protein
MPVCVRWALITGEYERKLTVAYKSATQPHCLWCSKRIAKHTTRHNVVTPAMGNQSFDEAYASRPKTITDCQKLTNEKVVSVDYQYETDDNYERTGRRVVHSYNTWDGESYQDQYFCNGEHARWFGYAAAEHGLRLKKRSAA